MTKTPFVTLAASSAYTHRQSVKRHPELCGTLSHLCVGASPSTPWSESAMYSDPQSLLGAVVDSYTLVRVVGAGGAGVVFLGQRADGSQSAIKVLLPAVRT